MKGKSNLNPNLKGLDQTLSGKYPYCLIGVQTTGDKENSEILRI